MDYLFFKAHRVSRKTGKTDRSVLADLKLKCVLCQVIFSKFSIAKKDIFVIDSEAMALRKKNHYNAE